VTSQDTKVQVGFDRPLQAKTALQDDKLGRRNFVQVAVDALRGVNSTAGFVLSIEGAWGSGKTSTLAMMQALLQEKKPAPIIVHFNPWLIGDRDALLRHFLARIAAEVKLADHAADGKKVARELKAYCKVFDFIKLIPGAEPWASMIKSVIEATGDSADSIAVHKAPDIEARKGKVEEALRKFDRPIIVFVDDIDRLFPEEVFEMVRIVKAVGDLPNIGYVLAWDAEYVSEALKAANVPRSQTYLDKVVQVRLPLPVIGLEARRLLINDAFDRLHPRAHDKYFANSENRLGSFYFAGLRDILEQPRDFTRVFNTVAVIEPALRGEVVLADIVALATLMLKAPHVYELMRKEPRWFVGRLPADHGTLKQSADILREGSEQRDAAIAQSSSPNATRRLLHRLFPLTAKADDEFAIGQVRDAEGHLASPTRLLVATQLHVSSIDVSLVLARRYLFHADQRDDIVRGLTHQNCLEFMESLGEVAKTTSASDFSDVDRLCLDIARMADTEPFPSKSRDRSSLFSLPPENIALQAIRMVIDSAAADRGSTIAEQLVVAPGALTLGMELFVSSYLSDTGDREKPLCTSQSKSRLTIKLAKNVLDAAKAGRLLETCNPGFILWQMSQVARGDCSKILAALKNLDPTLDDFAMAFLSHGYDSQKGRYYSLPTDRKRLEAYCTLEELQQHAKGRLTESDLKLPVAAAWRSVIEEKSIYGVDGSYARN
jgi:hypothetical protein